MNCPNKNLPEWKALVEKHGEARAFLMWNAGEVQSSTKVNESLLRDIESQVQANTLFFRNKYKNFLDVNLGELPKTTKNMAVAFYTRAMEAKDGTLFPESATVYLSAPSIESSFDKALDKLSAKFKFPYRVINDPSKPWKGKYIFDGSQRVVVINTAHADDTTAFHEYYHPAVRILANKNAPLFTSILNQARTEGFRQAEPEEAVTEFLATKAKAKGVNFYVAAFLQYIRRVMGLGKNLDTATRLSDVLAILNEGVDVSQENTLFEAYKNMDDLVRTISGSIVDRPKAKRGDYLEILRKEFKNITTSDASNFYQDENKNDVAKRLSVFIGDQELGEFSTKFKDKKYTMSQVAARAVFERAEISTRNREDADITETITFEGRELTYPQVVEYFDKIYATQRIYGKMLHSFMQYKLEIDPALKLAAKIQAEEYAKQYGVPFITLERHENLVKINENFQEIMEKAGIFIPSDKSIGVPKNKFDRVSPEVVLMSELVTDSEGKPIGTTADGLIQHENGDFSLVDWKSGNIAKDMNTSLLLQFGEELGITDSKLSRAYLELAFRALMLKEKFPEATFRNIQLIQLDKEGEARPMKLDLQPYLWVIGNYYKKTNPEAYAKMQAKGLYDVINYQGASSSLVKVYDQIQNLPFEDQLAYLKAKLASIHRGKTQEEINSNSQLKQLSAEYTEAILELEKVTGINLESKTPDLPYLSKGFKSFSDIANPKVQTLHKVIMEAKGAITNKLKHYTDEHDDLYNKVVKSANKSKRFWLDSGAGVSLVYSLISLNPFWFGITILSHKFLSRKMFPSTRSHFAFMWKQSTDKGRPGYFMNTEDYYIDNGQRIEMSEAQKNYRNFVHRTMKNEYHQTMHEIVGYKYDNPGQPIYKYQQLELPSELPDDFMPRVPKPLEEIREEEPYLKNWAGIGTTVSHRAKTFFTSFIEDHFENKATPIPLRYFIHSNSPIITDEAHSFNAESAYKMFMGNLLYKQNMDSVYDIAIGTSNALDEEKDEVGNKRYPLLTEWLNDSIFPHILGTSKDTKLMTRKWVVTSGAIMEKLAGIRKGTKYTISQEKVLRLMKTSVTFTVMAFKVWGPVRNALMIGLSTTTKTTQGIISKIVGVPPDGVDNLSIKGASTVFTDFIGKKLAGKEDESKLWNLAKKFDWLPDNHPYRVNNESLLSKSIQMSGTSHAYMFYQMGETFGALWHLGAMLKAAKIQTVDGKTVSMWDAYNDKGEWTAGVRGTVDQGNGVTRTLADLDALEIKTLKRGYEQLQGSYRQEEKAALEATVIGDFLFQFKKYFYQYMKVLFGSQYKDMTVGKYVMTGQKPDGMPNYQWHSEVMEGQFTVLSGAIVALLTPKQKIKEYLNDSAAYDSNTLRGHRKRALVSLLNTGLWFGLLMAVFANFFDDDDDDAFLKRELLRTIYDNTRGANPKDMFQTIQKPVVAAERISNIGTSLWTFMTEGMWGAETKDGWLKGSKTLLRATPGFSGAMQMQDLFKSNEDATDNLLDIVPMR